MRGKLEGLASFRVARLQAAGLVRKTDRILQILPESEREIRHIQRHTGFDWYWRVYFVLTSGAAD
jgi:hypothetical protein